MGELRNKYRDMETGQFDSVLKPEDEAYIINNYLNMTDAEMATQLKVNMQVIQNFRSKKGLMKMSYSYESAFGGVMKDVENNPQDKMKEKIEKSEGGGIKQGKGKEKQKKKNVSEFSYEDEKKALRKYLSLDIKKLIPSQYLKDIGTQDEFVDKFIILRKSFNDGEWRDFIAHWMRYMKEHQYDFNVAEDFDDLSGLIRELIIQSNIFDRNKNARTSDAFFSIYMKQFNESVSRQKRYQDNLKLSRKSRKSEKDYDKESFVEIVAMFDNEETRKVMAQADKEDNVELLNYMDKIRKKMREEVPEGTEIDGQESSLLMGISEEKVQDIVDKGIDVLEKEKIEK